MKSGASVATARALLRSMRQVRMLALLTAGNHHVARTTGSFARSYRHLLAPLLRDRPGHQARKDWRPLDRDASSHILLVRHGVWVHAAHRRLARPERPSQVRCATGHPYQVHKFIIAFTELSPLSRPLRWPFVKPSSARGGMTFPAQRVYYSIVTGP